MIRPIGMPTASHATPSSHPGDGVMWFFSATAWGVWITLQKAATLFGL